MNEKTNLDLENQVVNPQTTTTSPHNDLIKARKEAIREANTEPAEAFVIIPLTKGRGKHFWV